MDILTIIIYNGGFFDREGKVCQIYQENIGLFSVLRLLSSYYG